MQPRRSPGGDRAQIGEQFGAQQTRPTPEAAKRPRGGRGDVRGGRVEGRVGAAARGFGEGREGMG